MKRRHSGVAMVEFAIVGGVVLLMIISFIEIGRILYTWHLLGEAVRRTARLAVVCPIEQVEQIKRLALAPNNRPLLATLSPEQIELVYLKSARQSEVGRFYPQVNLVQVLSGSDEPDADRFSDIAFIRVTLRDYRLSLLAGILGDQAGRFSLQAPAFTALLPRESLGVAPSGTTGACQSP